MQRLLHDVIFLLLLWASAAQSYGQHGSGSANAEPVFNASASSIPQRSTPKASQTSNIASTLSSRMTCPSRTVNYITHTLPQQCLRTDRVSSTGTRTAESEANQDVSSISPSSSSLSNTAGTAVTTGTPGASKDASIAAGDIVSGDSEPSSTSSVLTPDSPSTAISPSLSKQTAEAESDSPLDNANFLSFEEWKRQNLAKAGQSPDNVGRAQSLNAGRERPGIENVLDAFGDENEISLDFSGFGPGAAHAPDTKTVAAVNTDTQAADQPSPRSLELRSKDAGKTCKERTNYASFDCAANVLKSNPECKSASSVLVENKDSYMLNICSANDKHFVIELCDDILVDTLVLANYEFFSSSFRHFRVSVSDRFPVKPDKWRDLGTYEARNTREVQAFLVENPLIWARYLRIEFLTHYGSEYYCPVSLLRVHGTTMIQEYLHEEGTRDDHADDSSVLSVDTIVSPLVPSNVIEPAGTSLESTTTAVVEASAADGSSSTPTTSETPSSSKSQSSNATFEPRSSIASVSQEVSPSKGAQESSNSGQTPSISSPVEETKSLVTLREASAPSQRSPSELPSNISEVANATSILNPSQRESQTISVTSIFDVVKTRNSVANASSLQQPLQTPRQNESSSTTVSAVNTTDTPGTGSGVIQSLPNSAVSSVNSTRNAPATSTSSQSAQPSTQESFYKSVHKRLQQLESNSTLSLQYIEEQSRILRDAFTKVEKRQLAATTSFLSNLNETVMRDLHGFQQAYDQLWQSTVIELEGQREQFQREMLSMSSRLTLVADELVWQKRMGIVQSTLVLMCLALVLFGRSGNGPLELPMMQHMMNKSTAALRVGWESPPHSPSSHSRSPVGLLRHRLWRSSTEHVHHLTDSESSRPQSVDGPEAFLEPSIPGTPDTASEGDEPILERVGQTSSVQPRPAHTTTSTHSKKRRKRQPSSAGANSKAKSPLAQSY